MAIRAKRHSMGLLEKDSVLSIAARRRSAGDQAINDRRHSPKRAEFVPDWSDFGVAVVRGWVTNCFALLAIGLACGSALAQSSPAQPFAPTDSDLPTRYNLPTDSLGSPAPSPSPRTSYQPTSPVPGAQPGPDGAPIKGTELTAPKAKPHMYSFTPRYGGNQLILDRTERPAEGTIRTVFTGGIIIRATGDTPQDDIELAADEGVFWQAIAPSDNKQNSSGLQPNATEMRGVEVYLSGNVIVRTKPKTGNIQTMRAKQLYYDIDREKAIALFGSMEYVPLIPTPSGPVAAPDPFRLQGQELWKLDAENYEARTASFNSSKLPSDPGLSVDAPRMRMTDRDTQLRNVFGLPYRDLITGEPVVGNEKIVTAYNAVPKVEGVPVFFFPYYKGDVNEPLGPFMSISGGENRIFGAEIFTTWNLFELFALKPPIGQRWTLEVDYLSNRGPAIGTDYRYHLPPADPLSGLAGADGWIKYYAIKDHGLDDLGGDRGPEPKQPDFRERFQWAHRQELDVDLYFQGQLAYLSDKNFLEQYYKSEFDTAMNQETFANLTWQRNNYWLSGLVEPHIDRPWVAETAWLPKLDGALIGQSFLDRIVYSARGDAAYALAHPTETNPVSILPTDQKVDTGRLDLFQQASVPFALGPVQFSPYAMLDLTGYSADLSGNAVGRVWGGGGARTSIALSHLYEDVASDLFNVRDLYHKMVLSANYLYAQTNIHYNELPMLNRLNDDATDQAWRNITPVQSQLVSGPAGLALQNSPVYDPQLYAIRRALLNQIDTLDDIDVLQLDLRQRLQTKRGYPGEEHEVDLATLDTSISYFPQPGRDNFGHPWAFGEWDFLWNVGDRVAVTSTGWIEPYSGGSRYWTLGAYLNRPDRTNFYLGYRQTDPLNSRAVTAAVGYQLSKRYFLNGSASYDFGLNQAMSNSLSLTRVGTDLTVTLGITYNSLVNNFGFTFMIMPNLFSATAPGGMPGVGAPLNSGR